MNIDDFLKEGGINVDELEESPINRNSKGLEDEKKEDPSHNTDPDDKMSGYLIKSTIKMDDEEGDDVLGMMISSIGTGVKFGLKLFTETIQLKQLKLYFAIKNGVLYWYQHERARQADNQIIIKEAKAIERDSKNQKEFYIIYKSKCYRLESDNEWNA